MGPNGAAYYDTLGWIQRARGNAKGALKALQKASQLEPKNPEIQYHLGVLYSEAGDKTKAIEARKLALNESSHAPSSAETKKLLKILEQ